MNAHSVLLLTHDREFEKLLREALRESGGTMLVAGDIDDALQIGCTRGDELDLAVIDRDDCHAITLLSAIKACCQELPIVVATSSQSCHCATVAYANGAAACVAKRITATEIELVLSKLRQPQVQLSAA